MPEWFLNIFSHLLPSRNATTLNLPLVRIEAGRFLMGSPPFEPGRDDGELETLHQVTITRPFMMGSVPITRAQFASFIDATGYKTSAQRGGKSIIFSTKGWVRAPGRTWRDGEGSAELFPVTFVSWHDAVAFCKWAGRVRGTTVRLPTDAEWEYACRAGTRTTFGGTGELDEMGWYAGNSGIKPFDCDEVLAYGREVFLQHVADNHCGLRPVGQKNPNAWGLYDMHGNTWEWCHDVYANYPAGPATDPTGPVNTNPKWRVMRGGQWADIPSTCRSANRGYFHPHDSFDTFSFRVVEEIG